MSHLVPGVEEVCLQFVVAVIYVVRECSPVSVPLHLRNCTVEVGQHAALLVRCVEQRTVLKCRATYGDTSLAVLTTLKVGEVLLLLSVLTGLYDLCLTLGVLVAVDLGVEVIQGARE